MGAFKIRGALVYMDWLVQAHPEVKGVVAATRGNHGQAVAFAANRYSLKSTIVVPFGNSREKNRAMSALGAELIEHGQDFQAASEFAEQLSAQNGYHRVPSFHELLVHGTGTYALEFLRGAPELDTVYVSIGLGSSICGMMAARAALNRKMRIIGVVAAKSPSYALSYREKKPVSHPAETFLADGLACREPNEEALQLILNGVERIVKVSEDEIARRNARIISGHAQRGGRRRGRGSCRLNAGERKTAQSSGLGVVLSGGNVDADVFEQVLKRVTD